MNTPTTQPDTLKAVIADLKKAQDHGDRILASGVINRLTALQAASGEVYPGESAHELFEAYVADFIDRAPDLRRLGEYLGERLDEDDFAHVNPMLLGIAEKLASPAGPAAESPATWHDQRALDIARRFVPSTECRRLAQLQVAIITAMRDAATPAAPPVGALELAAREVMACPEFQEIACTGSMAPCEHALGLLGDALEGTPPFPAGGDAEVGRVAQALFKIKFPASPWNDASYYERCEFRAAARAAIAAMKPVQQDGA